MAIHNGVKVVKLDDAGWQQWHESGSVDLSCVPPTTEVYQNTGIVLKSDTEGKDHGIVKGDKIVKFDFPDAFGVKPKNTEQTLAMSMLLDTNIKLKIITGKEGTGKNFITAACVLELLLQKKAYNKIVLTRTTDEVGKSLGLFPGSAEEKFANHTASFMYTFKAIMGKSGDYLDMLMEKGDVSYIPVQLMRGISFPPGTLIWADEIAGLSPYELRMLGTRLGEDCALILTGSFEQIDRKVEKEKTGLWKLADSPLILNSKLTSSIELIKNERSAISKLISDVL